MSNNLIARITQEECAEVIQAISKVLRFGIDHESPITNITNAAHLEEEMGQLIAMMQLLADDWKLNRRNVTLAYENKKANYDLWDNAHAN
jgi:hypothetical protein